MSLKDSLQKVIIKVCYFVYILDQIHPLRFLNESSKQSCNECSPCTEMETETPSSSLSMSIPKHRTRMQFQVHLCLRLWGKQTSVYSLIITEETLPHLSLRCYPWLTSQSRNLKILWLFLKIIKIICFLDNSWNVVYNPKIFSVYVKYLQWHIN